MKARHATRAPIRTRNVRSGNVKSRIGGALVAPSGGSLDPWNGAVGNAELHTRVRSCPLSLAAAQNLALGRSSRLTSDLQRTYN